MVDLAPEKRRNIARNITFALFIFVQFCQKRNQKFFLAMGPCTGQDHPPVWQAGHKFRQPSVDFLSKFLDSHAVHGKYHRSHSLRPSGPVPLGLLGPWALGRFSLSCSNSHTEMLKCIFIVGQSNATF